MDSALLIFEFKHISANIYTFRYTSPSIGWIPLEALAQLLVLGCILAYGRFLYATRWKPRIIYGASLLVCLLALYVSLENSCRLACGIALFVMSLLYSRPLFSFFRVPFPPLLPP